MDLYNLHKHKMYIYMTQYLIIASFISFKQDIWKLETWKNKKSWPQNARVISKSFNFSLELFTSLLPQLSLEERANQIHYSRWVSPKAKVLGWNLYYLLVAWIPFKGWVEKNTRIHAQIHMHTSLYLSIHKHTCLVCYTKAVKCILMTLLFIWLLICTSVQKHSLLSFTSLGFKSVIHYNFIIIKIHIYLKYSPGRWNETKLAFRNSLVYQELRVTSLNATVVQRQSFHYRTLW